MIDKTQTRIVLPFPPSINHYYLHVPGHKVILSPEGRAYRDEAKWRANMAVDYIYHSDVCMEVHLYRPMMRGDIDNNLKALLDSLIGIAYDDDKQVAELHVYRHDDKKHPRAEVTIWAK